MTAKSRIAILTAGLLGATGLWVSPALAAAPAADAPTTISAADTHDASVAVPFRKRKKSKRTTVIVVDSDQNGNTGGDGGNGGSGGHGGDCRNECVAGDGGNGGSGGDGGNGGGNND